MPGDTMSEMGVFVVILALIGFLFLKVTHKIIKVILVLAAIAALMVFVVPNFTG